MNNLNNQINNNKLNFIKYLLVAISSFILDILLFTIFNLLLTKTFSYESIIISTIFARIISSIYNYFCNSRFVFKKYNKKSRIAYFELVICQMIISSLLTYLINRFIIGIFVTIIKIIVDISIFIANYFIQKKIIFK